MNTNLIPGDMVRIDNSIRCRENIPNKVYEVEERIEIDYNSPPENKACYGEGECIYCELSVDHVDPNKPFDRDEKGFAIHNGDGGCLHVKQYFTYKLKGIKRTFRWGLTKVS